MQHREQDGAAWPERAIEPSAVVGRHSTVAIHGSRDGVRCHQTRDSTTCANCS